MNADIILSEYCLENLIKPFGDKEIDAVQPLLIYPQNMMTQSTGHIFCQYYNTHLFENRPVNDLIVQKEGYRKAFTTALCAVRKEIFFQYSGFNEEFFNAWEGMELGLKITTNGGKCLYTPDARAFHIRGGGRGQYKIDETPQTAYFWSTWGGRISENLSEILNLQLNQIQVGPRYCLINFSCIRNFEVISNKLKINISDSIKYTEYAGNKTIEFFKAIPYFWLNFDDDIIFLANNYTVIKNNQLWFKMRKEHNDIIIDLAGNCISCNLP